MIEDSYIQPASFAWDIDPDQAHTHLLKGELVARCKPLCDFINALDGRDAVAQLKAHGEFRILTREHFGHPLMRLTWKNETVALYGSGVVTIDSWARDRRVLKWVEQHARH